MATLTAPSVSVAFIEAAASAIERGQRGILAMLIVDATAGLASDYTIYDVADIPEGMTAANKTAIKLALKGYISAPRMPTMTTASRHWLPCRGIIWSVRLPRLTARPVTSSAGSAPSAPQA